jgi:hypothetical protein
MLADLARLSCIPETRRDEFCNFIVMFIIARTRQWQDRGCPKNLHAERVLLDAAAKVRAARNAVNALRDDQIPDVEGVSTYDEDALEEEEDTYVARGALNAIDRAFGVMIDRPADQRGREGAIIYPSFQRFVVDLWRGVEAHEGKLTYSNNKGRLSGTIVDALKLLKPHLPPTLRAEPTRSILGNAKRAVRRKRPGRAPKFVGPYTSLL